MPTKRNKTARARGADAERYDAAARVSGAHPHGKVRHQSAHYVAKASGAKGSDYWDARRKAEKSEKRRGAVSKAGKAVRKATTGSVGKGSGSVKSRKIAKERAARSGNSSSSAAARVRRLMG